MAEQPARQVQRNSLPFDTVFVCLGGIQKAANFHWNPWQPWVCMCDLHKQARIRHFVVWAMNITLDLKASEFWQEKPCNLDDCAMCSVAECPGGGERSGFVPQFRGLSSPKPHNVEIPLPIHLEFPSYDSLPVIDDTGENGQS